MPLEVLSALDTARTQYYHFKAIIVAGMGLFTDAYDLFCIPPIMRLIGRIHYENKHYKVPNFISYNMVAIALLGTVLGQLVFGHLGDRIGRRRVYGLSLTIMVLSSIGCGFSICTSRPCVLASLGFFRFALGVGIGGDYPLSATIMSEFANKKTRGSFIAAVFTMQGLGIIVGSCVTMGVCAIFNAIQNPPNDKTPEEADLAWRLILMIGALPAGLTFYWRMMMPETARYTALVERDVMQATMNMEKVLSVSLSQIAEDEEYPTQVPSPSYPTQVPSPSYPFFSKRFFRRHGRDLFSCSIAWLLVDVVFYSINLVQTSFYDSNHPRPDLNAYQDAYQVARFQAIVVVCSAIPGYWASVFFIDRIGRVKIQFMGFLFMSVALFVMGVPYEEYWQFHQRVGFFALYGLALFFSNFGPNTTTFIVPAELFPARFRSTCHGISGASGKVGAIIGTIGVLWASDTEHDMDSRCAAKRIKIALEVMGGLCILGMVVTYLFTPETNGRSLEENENDDGTQDLCMLRSFKGSCRSNVVATAE